MGDTSTKCPSCHEKVDPSRTYCSNCGIKLQGLSTSSEIDAYVRARVDQELSGRLEDQDLVVTVLASKAEELLWTKLKRYGGLAAVFTVIFIAAVGFLGIKSFNDTVGKVATNVTQAAQQVQAERDTINKTAAESTSLKTKLDGLSVEVQSQAEQVRTRGAQIAIKLDALEKGEIAAQDQLQAELLRAKGLGEQLSGVARTLETTVTQVAKQADDVELQEAYPTLGQPSYITYRGSPWKGPAGKRTDEKWLSLYIGPDALPKFLPKDVTSLIEGLKHENVVTYVGEFGTGGSQPSGFLPFELMNNSQSVLTYFRIDDAETARRIAALCSTMLSVPVSAKFVDYGKVSMVPIRKLVADDSGLDFQLILQGL